MVYDIISKEQDGDLKDRSRAPKHQPGKTPAAMEEKVIELKNRSHLGPERPSRFLEKYKVLSVPHGTMCHILARSLAARIG